MIAPCAGMNIINTELGRTQNELVPLLATNPTNSNELKSLEFVSFHTSSLLFIADFAAHDLFHRKGRKDGLIGHYAINHRELREKWQSIAIPVTVYDKAAASRSRTRMTLIARIFADIVDRCALPFHSSDNKPQRSQRTQSRLGKLWAVRVLDNGLALFSSWITRIYTYPCVSASSALSAFHRRLSAFIRVHLRLISVSLNSSFRGEQ